MSTFNRRRWLTLAGALPLANAAAAATAVSAQGPGNFWPAQPVESPRETIRKRYFPDVALQTHDGKNVRFYEDLIKNKFVMINFIYMNCSDGTCPVTTHNLALVQKMLKDRVGRDLFMYSITIDPENDTPQLLNRYAKSYHAGPGWLFLRASPQDTEILRRKLGFFERDAAVDARKSSHLAMLRYGNEPRQLWSATSAMISPASITRNVLSADWPSRVVSPQGRPVSLR